MNDQESDSAFRILLRRYRRHAQMSIEALAESCGVSPRAISDLERGVSQPRQRTVRLLADALRLSDAERQQFITAAAPAPSSSATIGLNDFPRLLRRYRETAQFSQRDLARRALISARAISDLERGVNRVPRRQTVILLADALQLTGLDRRDFETAAQAATPTQELPDRRAGSGSVGGTLPVSPWSLVGREDELAALLSLVANPAVHLVTVTGMGGAGKTRLAVEAGARLAERNVRVVFVSLVMARSASEVVHAVAAALEIGRGEELETLAEIQRVLGSNAMVMLLDNAEQVPDIARVTAALAMPGAGAAGASTLIVTSRILLRLTGERELFVGPLAVPPLVEPTAGKRLRSGAGVTVVTSVPEPLKWPAVELFVQRAEAASPGWTVPDGGIATLVEVCSQVDGLPLALELLAPWVRVLSLAAIKARLTAGHDLVSAAGADTALRHRSLSAVLDTSYALLDPAAQITFRRLAVFPSWFEVETAEVVCGDDGLNVLANVATLRDASLLIAEREPDGELRLCYLQVVHDYAAAALAHSGEADAMRARHAAAIADLAETAAPHLTHADQRFWLERLDRVIDDLRAAQEWYLEQGNATRLAGNLWRYWYSRGLPHEGRDWLVKSLAVSQAAGPDHDLATVLYGAGVLTYLTGDVPAGQDFYGRALEAYLAIEDRSGAANCLNNLGMIKLYQGELETARIMYEQALDAARRGRSTRAEGVSLANLAKVAVDSGYPDEARSAAQAALKIFTELGDPRTVADLHGLLAECALRDGHQENARELWRTALDEFISLGDHPGTAPILVELGLLDLYDGQLDAALDQLEDGRRLAEEMKDGWTQAAALVGMARHAHLAGNDARACELLAQAGSLARSVKDAAVIRQVEALRSQWLCPG
jgi:predicted ATPase/transcriptional regulator with XRE-family HTH domain